MEEILRLAADLGERIAQHDRFKQLRAAEDAVSDESESRDKVRALDRQRAKVAELEAGGRPVEPEDKRELQRLAEAVHSDARLQALAKAQADYMELMNRVNETIRKKMESSK
jgi:cell fate (sporulation/competence/biofilm development) regulator YlbF (YheA/YmcA/DUF963 family)